MAILQEEIRACIISTEEINSDIAITRKEIEGYEYELKILRNNPQQNRLEIYLREGKIAKRRDFIADLIEILRYRKYL